MDVLGTLAPYLVEAEQSLKGSSLTEVYKAADILVLPQLQNDLVDLRIQVYYERDYFHNVTVLIVLARLDLLHTPIYRLVLRSAVGGFVSQPDSDTECSKNADGLIKYPKVVKDFIMTVNRYNRQPWPKITAEDACQFHLHPDGTPCTPNKSLNIIP